MRRREAAGLLEPDRQKAIIGELLEKQRARGGWSLSSLSGGWKRADGTFQETTSDGYATGLITFVLQRAGISRKMPNLNRGLAWLTANQDKKDGSWASYSLNKNKENHISPETALFMNDADFVRCALSDCRQSSLKNSRLVFTDCGPDNGQA